MGLIREKFRELKKQGKKAFIPYMTFGFPDMKTFESIVMALDRAGADFIEIGLPFSDPIADGPIIQTSSKIALDKGANIYKLLSSLKKLKSRIRAPLILMTYYNPVYHMGIDKFFKRFSRLIDGVIVADLLAEEAGHFVNKARENNIDTIFFISPTTQKERLRLIDRLSSGFIYYISVTGVTGPRKTLPSKIFKHIKKIKKQVRAAVCIGFGISSQKQARMFKKYFDGVIAGSVLIKKILICRKNRNFLKDFEKFTLWLNG
ncbi:MAG: tryptophan synthase subunit alpha [Candidatus Omnitrophica bacterium]|nr:tryptophan synthase subunit alpha [Candidatus Omnitrophota bacterium]